MSTPMIEARNIHKSFGDTQALAGVDLSVEAGRIVALLGPNGAGKTTLVRILTTLLRADVGAVRIAGLDVMSDADDLRTIIGLSGQFAAIDDLLTGQENLELVAELYHLGRREARQRARASLEQFGLAAAAGQLARTYSGGMRRRLDLAAALIGEPPVLILDEPTTGLDPRTRAEMWEVVEALVAAGSAVLLTTQYLEEADRLAHRIVVIDHGRIIAEGTADELKDRVGGDVVEMRVPDPAQLAPAAAALASAGDGGVSVDQERQRLTLPAPGGARTLSAVLGSLEKADLTVHNIGLRGPSLDDVYLTLTGARPAAGPPRAGQTPSRKAR